MRSALAAAVMACLATLPPLPAVAETRLALVIGNSDYTHTQKLPNPARDAELMAATLESVGFEVTKIIDADQTTMKRALVEFGRKLKDSDAVGLFYYAGHGVSVRGDNYLIPVDANIADETEVPIGGVNVNEFLLTMERAQSRINIVILDACRNNPYPGSSRSGSRGLSRIDAPSGTYVAFATGPGQVADDGAGENSPYTKALSSAITRRGIAIEQAFKIARADVQRETEKRQTPWESSSITGDFFFVPGGEDRSDQVAVAPTPAPLPKPVATPAPIPAPQPAKADPNIEIAFWNSIKDSDGPEAFQIYLDQYPSGTFAPLARLKIKQAMNPPQPEPAPITPQPQPLPEPEVQPQPQPQTTSRAMGPAVMFPWSSTNQLAGQQLAGLGCDQLWIARNEIYARNGYCFQTPRGRSYFGNANCSTTSQDILSRLEKANVTLIKSWESRLGCR